MNATHKIKIDLVRKGVKPTVEVMQYDTNSRTVEIMLLENSAVWMPPAAAALALSYRKSDGTRGFYNKLDDDTSAISVSGNTVSVILAQQVLTVPGAVEAALVINDAERDRLTSFPFDINVTADPSAGTTASDDYFNCEGVSGVSTIYYNSDTSVSSGASRKISKASTASWTSIGFHAEPKKNDLVISASSQMFKVTSVLSTYLTMSHLADLGGPADAVLYTEQTLTPEQQAQARANIGAVSETEVTAMINAALENIETLPSAEGVGF